MIVKEKRRMAGKAHNVIQKTWVLTKDIKEKRNKTENKEVRNQSGQKQHVLKCKGFTVDPSTARPAGSTLLILCLLEIDIIFFYLLVALNYQNKDRETYVNFAQFRRNGGCGYILKPECLRSFETSFSLKNQSHSPEYKNSIKLIVRVRALDCWAKRGI